MVLHCYLNLKRDTITPFAPKICCFGINMGMASLNVGGIFPASSIMPLAGAFECVPF